MKPILAWNDRLMDLLEQRHIPVAELARLVAGAEATENEVESVLQRLYKYAKRSNEASKPVPRPRGDMLPRIALALGVTPVFLEFGTPDAAGEAAIGALRPEPRKRIELQGRGQGGDDGEIVLGGGPVGYADMPPSLEGVRGAFGVYIHGDSMVPRYFSGDIVFMNPVRPTNPGDFVLIEIQREDEDTSRGFVKRLVTKNQKEVVVEQYNPPKRIRFPRRLVKNIYYILRPGE
jgi:hypothetical protein